METNTDLIIDDMSKISDEDIISILKERAKRKIEEGKIKQAIEILKDVIFLLRKEKRYEEADLIELTMNQYHDDYYQKKNS
jgi:hypothetical protein